MTYCSALCASQSDTGAIVAPKAAPKQSKTIPTKPSPARVAPAAPKLARSVADAGAAPVVALASESTQAHSLPLASREEVATPRAMTKASPRRTALLIGCAAIAITGITILVVPGLFPGKTKPSDRATSALTDVAEPGAGGPKQPVDSAALEADKHALPSAAVLRRAAIEELESHLLAGGTRFQRLAGIALARIQNPSAVARLTELLAIEDSDLSRIDIAYGMALGGESKGRDYLVNELKNKRRDVRIDAARRLAELGDDAGRKTLVQMLSVRSHRLGAASVLAMLDDAEGLAVLSKTLNDKGETDENRMRAAVGLGRAGDQSARELLLEILHEGRYVVDAAGALAALGDKEAVPALERQLELSAMRVAAAESLRAMGAEVDLTIIATAMTSANEDGRIAAAEAILILTPAEALKTR